jgi:hypothetical protein
LKFCHPETGGFRPLNGDKHWYLPSDDGNVRLSRPEDYLNLIKKNRTLYALADIMEDSVKEASERWIKEHNKPEQPIGTLKDCLAYTLFADIDSIGDIIGNPAVKQAVEEMAKFLVQKLRGAGVEKSVHLLYSGGGVYLQIHHSLCQTEPGRDRERDFRRATGAFNRWLAAVEYEFFQANPQYKGLVKVDKLNGQKKKLKCVFSIHAKHQLAVVPLDPKNITIDFEKAKLPLSTEFIAAGERWYQEHDVTEINGFGTMLAPYLREAQKELDERKARSGDYEIWRRYAPLAIEEFPPCMKNILVRAEPGRGPHRALAVLAAFFYQAGWSQEAAFKVWWPIASRCGVETRIFSVWFGEMLCPNCKTIQDTSGGYPKTGLGGLGYCERDELCRGARWPGGYGNQTGDSHFGRSDGNGKSSGRCPPEL